jgi:hypothetical protein
MAPKYKIMFTYDPHDNIGFRSDFKLFLRIDFLSFQKFQSSFRVTDNSDPSFQL